MRFGYRSIAAQLGLIQQRYRTITRTAVILLQSSGCLNSVILHFGSFVLDLLSNKRLRAGKKRKVGKLNVRVDASSRSGERAGGLASQSLQSPGIKVMTLIVSGHG